MAQMSDRALPSGREDGQKCEDEHEGSRRLDQLRSCCPRRWSGAGGDCGLGLLGSGVGFVLSVCRLVV